jgi:hypothetical protein
MLSKHNFAVALEATLGGSILIGNTEMGSIESTVCFRTEVRTAQWNNQETFRSLQLKTPILHH